MRKLYSLFLVLLIASGGWAQLQPQLTQHLYNPISFNPATAGYREALSATLSHRQMWSGFDGTPTTASLGIHTPVFSNSFGAGLLVQRDKIGVSRALGVSGLFAYRLKLSRGKLCFGVRAGMTNQLDQWSALVTTEAGDASFGLGDTQTWLPELGAGLYYYQKKMYAGISVPTFYTRTNSPSAEISSVLDPSAATYIAHLGGYVDIGPDINIQGGVLSRYQSAAQLQADASLMCNYKERIGIGGAFRPGNSWSAMVRIFATHQLVLVYSYDKFTSRARSFDSGTHEITCTFDLVNYSHAPDTRFF